MHKKLHYWIIGALVLGVAAGWITQKIVGLEGINDSEAVRLYTFLGKTVFVGLLKMVIVPLIFSSIVTGIASLGTGEGFGRLGLKTVGYYMLTSVIAIFIGLTMVNVVQPGLVDGKPNPAVQTFIENNRAEFESKGNDVASTAETVEGTKPPLGVIGELITRMIPANVVSAASESCE